MIGRTVKQLAGAGILMAALTVSPAHAQKTSKGDGITQFVTVEQPDAQRTQQEFNELLQRYPPTLRNVFKQDPSLLTQQAYLAPYPVLVNYLNTHPEIALNPNYYLGGLAGNRRDIPEDRSSRALDMWYRVLSNLMVLAGFAVVGSVIVVISRTVIDYRRWNRLSKTQQEVHTKILDRFSNNDEVMAYVTSQAGSRFLQSAPISLDTGTASRSMGAPLNRIMWSVQAGFVLAAAGGGLMIASGRVGEDATLPLEVMGILAMALGIGFVVSAGISYLLSHRLGLLDPVEPKRSIEPFGPQQ